MHLVCNKCNSCVRSRSDMILSSAHELLSSPAPTNLLTSITAKQIAAGIQLLLYTQMHQWGLQQYRFQCHSSHSEYVISLSYPFVIVLLSVRCIRKHMPRIADRNTAEYLLSSNKARHASSFSTSDYRPICFPLSGDYLLGYPRIIARM